MWNLKDTKYPKYLKNNQARATIHSDFKLYHKVIGTKHYSTGMKTDIEINETEQIAQK